MQEPLLPQSASDGGFTATTTPKWTTGLPDPKIPIFDDCIWGKGEVFKWNEKDKIEDKSEAGMQDKKQDKKQGCNVRLLSLDGGGVKGIMAAHILGMLEKRLQHEVTIVQKAYNRKDKESKWNNVLWDIKSRFGDPVQLSGVKPDKLRIVDFFDVIAGTSAGGLIAAFLTIREPDGGKSIRPASELPELYEKVVNKTFPKEQYKRRSWNWKGGNPPTPGVWWNPFKWPARAAYIRYKCIYLGWYLWRNLMCHNYDEKNLETLLKQHLGNAMASHAVKPCLITSYNFTRQQPHIWNCGIPIPEDKNQGPKDKDQGPEDMWEHKLVLMWQICRATSAAPSYLKPAQVTYGPSEAKITDQFIDGGLFANDPVFFAYRWPFANIKHLQELGLPLERWEAEHGRTLTLSLGCGEVIKGACQDDASQWSNQKWAVPAVHAAMDGTAQAPYYGFFYPFRAVKRLPAYMRLQPIIKENLNAMDNASNLEELKGVVTNYLKGLAHRPGLFTRKPNGSTVAENHLAWKEWRGDLNASYCDGKGTDAFIDELLKEKNAEHLSRFAQLLVKEWIQRLALSKGWGVGRCNGCNQEVSDGPSSLSAGPSSSSS